MRTCIRRMVLLACTASCLGVSAQELPAVKPVGKTSYDAVAKYLTPGGSLYAYISTDEWAGKLDKMTGDIEGLVMPNLDPTQATTTQAVFKMVHRFIAESGLAELGGLGLSSVKTGDDLYHNRVVAQRLPGGTPGVYWQVFGAANAPMDLLKILPANTALAAYTRGDLKPLWAWIRKAVRESGSQPMADGFEQSLQQLQTQGIALDTWITSLGGGAAILLTIDPEKKFSFPAGASGAAVQVPGFALALLIEVQDDTIFKAVDGMLAANPQVERKDAADLRQRVIPLPLPPPLRVTVAQYQGTLILSTSDELVGQLVAGTGGLTETPLFKQLAAAMPSQGTGFSFLSPALGTALTQIMQSALANGGADAAAAGLPSKLFMNLEGQAAYGVNVNTPEGLVGLSNTNFDYGQTLIAQGSIVPIAVMTGMLLPALSQARLKAQRVSDMSNLKQIGLGLRMASADDNERFPDDLGVLMEKGYISAGQVFVCPTGKTPAPTNAAEVRAGQCDYVYFGKGHTEADFGPEVPIACTKPGMLGGQYLNVAYGDGHVRGFEAPPEDVKQLLAKAGGPGAGQPRAPNP